MKSLQYLAINALHAAAKRQVFAETMRPRAQQPKLRWRRKAGKGHRLIRNLDGGAMVLGRRVAQERFPVYLHSAARRRAIEGGLTAEKRSEYLYS